MNARILLIEDSPERIDTFRLWLEGTGFVLDGMRDCWSLNELV